MLCTPFLLVPSFYTWSLLLMSLVILIHWEITYKRHPERFSERTNESLRCQNCTEKLCRHKVQLKHYIAKHRDILFEKLEPIGEGIKDTYGRAKEKTAETYEKVKTKTVETYERVKDKTVETYERAKEKTKDFTKDAYGKVKDRAGEVVTTVRDMKNELFGKEKDAPTETSSTASHFGRGGTVGGGEGRNIEPQNEPSHLLSQELSRSESLDSISESEEAPQTDTQSAE